MRPQLWTNFSQTFPKPSKRSKPCDYEIKLPEFPTGMVFGPPQSQGFPWFTPTCTHFALQPSQILPDFIARGVKMFGRARIVILTTFIYITTGSLVSQATWLIYLAIIVGLFLRLAIWTLSLLTVHQTGIFIILLYTGQSPQFHNAPTASSHLAVMP